MGNVHHEPAPAPRWPGLVLARLRRWLAAGTDIAADEWAAPAAAAADPCVLVADDDPVHRLVASAMLTGLGVRPLLAADGGEAVALACELSLDLVLMDLQMPVLDGLAASRQIRHFEQANARARVPIVAYSSNPFAFGATLLHDCGVDAVLVKPCERHEMQACLARWQVRGVSAIAVP